MPNELVVGCVGRVSYQKNPLFSVRVLAALKKSAPEARLLLVGDGELEDEVSKLATELGIAQDYIHVGSVPNPEDYYSALDVFLLPSHYEGFPYALVEAQCSGLPCVVSEAVQAEVIATDWVQRMPFKAGTHAWSEAILYIRIVLCRMWPKMCRLTCM